ncbi:MAG: hemolysin D [Pseudomonadota bacterium]
MSIAKRLLILPPILIGAGIVYWAVANRPPPERVELSEPATVARVITVAPRDFTPRVSGFGTVEPANTWEAIPQVSGRVIEVHPDFARGAFVPEGTVLVRLATEDYELEIAEAIATIEGSDADIEELQLNQETLSASLAIQRDVLALEESQLARQQELLSRGVTSDQVVEDQQSAVLQQRATVQDLENELSLIPSRLRALETTKARAEVSLGIAELNLSRTVLTAPFDARVAEANIEAEQFAASGASIGTLDGLAAAEIDVQIPPNQMRGFILLSFDGLVETYADVRAIAPNLARLSAKVQIGFDDLGIVWPATVVRISDMVDPETRSIGVIVQVADPYGEINPSIHPPLVKGMFTEVDLFGPVFESAILVPRNAIREGQAAIVGNDNRLQRVPVTIGYEIGDVALIIDGLSIGDQVIVSDLATMVSGMLLAPIDDPDAEARLDAAANADGVIDTAGAQSQ